MTHYQLVSRNKQKSFLVIFLFVFFIVGVSALMTYAFNFNLSIIGIVLVISGLMSFSSYWYSDKIILGISKAHPATREKYFDFYTVAENLASSQRMPKPKLYVIQDSAMNAFATGRDPDHAVICVTTGLLQKLTRAELEGVIAHELSHVRNYDIRLMSILTILVGLVVLLSDFLLRSTFYRKRSNEGSNQMQAIMMIIGLTLAIISPLIASVMKLAVSRNREFLADASGVGMTKNPAGLIRALEKISMDREPLEAANKATAHMYISDPLKNNKKGMAMFASLFMTHPPVNERLKALKRI